MALNFVKLKIKLLFESLSWSPSQFAHSGRRKISVSTETNGNICEFDVIKFIKANLLMKTFCLN